VANNILSPVRVLTVGNMYPPHHFGGYELVWQAAVDHMRSHGHEVRVLTTDTRTRADAPDSPDVHRELRWSLRDARFVSLTRREKVSIARHNHRVLGRHLDELGPDVVSWWSMGGLTLTLLETVRRRGVPAVAFVHDDWLDYGVWADPWMNVFQHRPPWVAALAEGVLRIPARADFDGAAKYVFVSDHTRRHALECRPLSRTGVAHSGIHEDFLDPAPPQPWRWRLLYVGRLDPRKGVDTAVEALALLPDDARLELIGGWDTQEEERLETLARERGVESRVVFSGQCSREQIRAAYAAADVVVFPVRWEEPWGLVPLEAMARGRPVVATGRGGSAEYLRDGENCVLFAAGDAAALAAAVRRVADDEGLRERLRTGGLETAPRHTEAGLNEAVEHELLAAGA
jgi:glycosyltransferase involved in cell wall biosynthesis